MAHYQRCLFVCFLVCASYALAVRLPAQTVTADNIELRANPLPRTPGGLTWNQYGTIGTTSNRYYWVSAVFPQGESRFTGPARPFLGPAVLNAVNFFRLRWNPVPGASSYNLVRTATATYPASGNILVTNTTSNFFDDQGGALSAYVLPSYNPPEVYWLGATGNSPQTSILNNIRFVDIAGPSPPGIKIRDCFDRLPSTGGTCDARGLEGVQALSTNNPFAGAKSNVTLLLGAATIPTSVSWVATANNQRIVGIGPYSSILKASGAVAWIFDGATFDGLILENLGFEGNGTATGAVRFGTGASTPQNIHMSNIRILGVNGIGLDTGGTIDSWFEKVDIQNVGGALTIGIAYKGNENNFKFCRVGGASIAGLDLQSVGNVEWFGGIISGGGASIRVSANLSRNSFIGSYFENSANGIVTVNAAGSPWGIGALNITESLLHTSNVTNMFNFTNANSGTLTLVGGATNIAGGGATNVLLPTGVSGQAFGVGATALTSSGAGTFDIYSPVRIQLGATTASPPSEDITLTKTGPVMRLFNTAAGGVSTKLKLQGNSGGGTTRGASIYYFDFTTVGTDLQYGLHLLGSSVGSIRLGFSAGVAGEDTQADTPIQTLTPLGTTLHVGVGNNGSALKHARTAVTNCATTGCEVTVTWTTAFADANYTPTCSILDATAQGEATGLRLAHLRTQTAAAITVDFDNFSGATVSGTLNCIAVHD